MLIYFIALFQTINSFSFLDPDFGWHLFLGQEMVEKRKLIESLNGYSTFSNVQLPDHEWLSDIILYKIYNSLGYLPLILIAFLILVLILYLLGQINKRTNKKSFASASSLLLLLLPLSISYGVRVQIILFLAVALILYISKTIKSFRTRLVYYFFLFLLGNNLHGGFMVLTVLPLLLEFDISIKNYKNILIKEFLLVIVLILALSINPYGLHLWELAFQYLSDHYYQSHISEWRTAFDLPLLTSQLLLPFSLYLFVLTINQYWKKIPKNELVLILLFAYLGLKYIRFFPIFALIITPYFASSLDDMIKSFKIRLPSWKNPLILLAIICYFGFQVSNLIKQDMKKLINPFQNQSLNNAEAVLRNTPPKNGIFLNSYDDGGYLIWTLSNHKVFIDGRGPQVKIDNNTTLLEENSKFYNNDPAVIKSSLSKYNISSVLVTIPKNNLSSLDKMIYKLLYNRDYVPFNNLQHYLEKNSDWTMVYKNNNYELFYLK